MASGGLRNNAGRKPTPTNIKALKGTLQKSRINKDEPKTTLPKNLQCPEWLQNNDEVVKIWDWAINTLKNTKILAESDMITVEQFCLTYVTTKYLWTTLSKDGWMYIDGKGDKRANPNASQLNQMLTQLRQFSALLGLDPANRARLKTEESKPLDGFEQLLQGK